MIAKVHHRTVELDEPLGDRKVVGSDGEAVPLEKPGARLPR
ncbi:Large membrane protein OS=Streptomyces glaucescens OX=1907 GN=SGLAU_09845 PE=4 SV=1 [Streptomyces glaucescens]